jgi:hypothetical protein
VKQVKVAQILSHDDKRRSARSVRGTSADGEDGGIDDVNRRLSKA